MNTGKLPERINERVQRSAKKQPGIQMPGCLQCSRFLLSHFLPEHGFQRAGENDAQVVNGSINVNVHIDPEKFHDIAEKGAAKEAGHHFPRFIGYLHGGSFFPDKIVELAFNRCKTYRSRRSRVMESET